MSGKMYVWEDFQVDFVQVGKPRSVEVWSNPSIFLYVADKGSEIGIRIEVDTAFDPPRPLGKLQFARVSLGERDFVQVSVRGSNLFKPAYSMLAETVDLVAGGMSPVDAASDVYARWKELLRVDKSLGREIEIGLWGELYAMSLMAPAFGGDILSSWVGPEGEPHDFRFPFAELEVKTTRGRERAHRINGIGQLEPSHNGSSLYLLSVMVQVAGDGSEGMTVRDLAEKVASMVSGRHREAFRERLETSMSGLPEVLTPMSLRRPCKLYGSSDVPRLTSEFLASGEDTLSTHLLRDIQYTTPMPDAGMEEGTVAFNDALSSFRFERKVA